jgi:putative oxidoreductase
MKKKVSRKTTIERPSAEKIRTERIETTPARMADHGDCMCGDCGTSCAAWGLTILRVVVGAAFMWHGISKFLNLAGTQGFFSQLFGAAGPVLAMLIAAVEVLGGLALILGFFVRWAAYVLAAVLVVAIVWAKKFGWPAIELELVLLASLFALAWNGPGKFSLHDKCGCCN